MLKVNRILGNKYLIISVLGHHAGESESEIFRRKKEEIKEVGKSFWLIKSFKARTEHIQDICKIASDENQDVYCVFIQASQKNGAQPTKNNSVAVKFSPDNLNWFDIPRGIKVTGKIDKNTTALVLETLEFINKEDVLIDLWNYSYFLNNHQPIKIMQGASTILCVRKYNIGMKSRYRKIIAIAKLKEPFAVWLK
ncbi:hypothetical protein J7J90_00005 [Candidatus Micrarchaeota archaeon]|nr:hypothetical protein [Candidatus Micrarchaeota archaeon]